MCFLFSSRFRLKSKEVNKKLMSIPNKSVNTQDRADIRQKGKSKRKEHGWDLNKQ